MANAQLRSLREAMRLTQDEFARAIREAGEALGQPNDCTVRTVQRWEDGSISYPRMNYVRAIERVAGHRAEDLGFDHVPRVGKLSDHMDSPAVRVVEDARLSHRDPIQLPGTLTGIWESRCFYHSGSRGEDLVDVAHMVLIHAGDKIAANTIEGSGLDGGKTSMDLGLRGNVVTGTWEETTGAESYYRGQVFHGAVQLLVDASGARMKGAWTGFGRDFDVNTGPWELIRKETGTRNVEAYARVPEV